MSGYDLRVKVRMHQRAKRLAIAQHEIKVNLDMWDRSHYRRAELLNGFQYIRFQMKFVKKHSFRWKQLMWEWQLNYVRLRLCFRFPLPWEVNRYCRWV